MTEMYIIGQSTATSAADCEERSRDHVMIKGISNPGFQEEPGQNVDTTNINKSECGCGLFRPNCLKKCNSAKFLLMWLSLAAFIQGMIVNGFVNVVITTIEKRFHLSSAQSGLMASSYDIASLIALLPVSYFGGAGCRPRWLAFGMILIGIGSLLFSVPHFVAGNYEASGNVTTNVCSGEVLSSSSSPNSECASSSVSRFQYIFIVAQLFLGVGAAPLYTLGVSFLDDSVKLKLSSLYVGIFYAFATLGPAVGYLLGGQFLRLYIDFDRVSLVFLTTSSPSWLGAWWIGFLAMGSVAILLSVPLLMFPSVLPHTLEYRSERTNETHRDVAAVADSAQIGLSVNLGDLAKAGKLLLMNKTFVCLTAAAAADVFVVTGIATYGTKIIESQFGYSASAASIIMAASIPMGAGGNFLGGYLVKRLGLQCTGILKFCVICSGITLLTCFVYLAKCPNEKFAGINTAYNGSKRPQTEDLISNCNARCSCSENGYDPVCALESNTMFLTPCHAGCSNFYDCSCIGSSSNQSQPVARRMVCPSSCSNLNYVFIVVFALMILFTFLSSIPSVSATLRCVSATQRPFAMGVQSIIARALGSVPGPLCFGVIIDKVCSYWQRELCDGGKNGRCLMYDTAGMSMAIFSIALVGKTINLAFFLLAWWLYKPPLVKPEETNSKDHAGACESDGT